MNSDEEQKELTCLSLIENEDFSLVMNTSERAYPD